MVEESMNSSTNNLESDPSDQRYFYSYFKNKDRYEYIKNNIYGYYGSSTKEERNVC